VFDPDSGMEVDWHPVLWCRDCGEELRSSWSGRCCCRPRMGLGRHPLGEVSIIPSGTDPRRWVGIDEVEHAPGAAELLYRALLTPMPLQRAELAAIAAQTHITIGELETVTHDAR